MTNESWMTEAGASRSSVMDRAKSARVVGQAGRLLSLTRFGGKVLSGLVKPNGEDCRRGAEALQQLASSLCRAHGWHAQVFGELPNQPAVLVSNHLSYIDPLIHCSLAPCSPIAKDEVASWPLIGKVSSNMAVNFVRRGDVQSGAVALRRALSALEAGVNVLNFPEGTTTNGHMLRFQRGVFGVAGLASAPVVPLALSFERRELAWVNDEMLLPHYARTLRSGPCIFRVKVGPRMYREDYESADEMARAARLWIHEQLERVWPDLQDDDRPRISLLVARQLERQQARATA